MSQNKWSVIFVIFLLLMVSLQPVSAATTIDQFTYDANGNMIEGNGFVFEYSDANQLVRIINASDSAVVAEYFYDANGQRVKKVENGVTTYYTGSLLETRVSGTDAVETSYYFANNERVARKDSDGAMYYYHSDHLGSTSVVTDASGALSEKVDYLPYGSVQEHAGEGSTYLFTDQEFDAESGLYYYDARYYDPELTRFTQPDSIIQEIYNPQNLNKYAYVLNNPVRYTDPSGHGINLMLQVGADTIVSTVKSAIIPDIPIPVIGQSAQIAQMGSDLAFIAAALFVDESNSEQVNRYHEIRDTGHVVLTPSFWVAFLPLLGLKMADGVGLIDEPVIRDCSGKEAFTVAAIFSEGWEITREKLVEALIGNENAFQDMRTEGDEMRQKWESRLINKQNERNSASGG
ncbi:MAG: hypothetical protein APR53_00120 [Methanoculleus sp. SDB]|nr:MAG: hypothetical protein APR53_00120 [Methanoculleus sp. SDB]